MAGGLKCAGLHLRGVTDGTNRRWTHLHGLIAGSLFVLAAFLVWTVPAAVARILRGEISAATLAWPTLWTLLFGGGLREAKLWNAQRTAQAI